MHVYTLILSPETKPLLASLNPHKLPKIHGCIYVLMF